MVNFYSRKLNFFRYLLRFWSDEAKCVQLGCFHRVDLFALKFHLYRVVTTNHPRHQKTTDTGQPDGEDRIPVRSLALTQYRSVTDRRTDRQRDLP